MVEINFMYIYSWLAISHYFFVRKNPKGLGDIPQQAGASATSVASKANACQTT